MSNPICPWCEVGELGDYLFSDTFEFSQGPVVVDGLLGQRCDKCGEILIFPQDIRHNEALIREARASQTGD